MPVAAAMNNLRAWRERQQARQDHERIHTEEEEEEEEIVMTHPLEEEAQPPALADSTSEEEEDDEDEDEEDDIENQRRPAVDLTAAAEGSPNLASTVNGRRSRSRRSSATRRSRFSLEDLEEERELARRRTSGCVLIAAFVLFRLWIQAVATSDFGLLLLCLVGTSWTARFIRHNREREEHLDRLIVEYNENGGSPSEGSGSGAGSDMRMLSFQAQLALAIIESQRQVMQGGYGHPDGAQNTPGVSDEAMEHWKKFPYKASDGLPDSCGHKSMGDDEEPHCSICLCEYEEKDDLVCLPCGHVYHGDCISSWCSNHQRCPLCNLDLESVTKEDDETSATTSS
mmetsp:Transcript_27474/g.66712  ORF Transcript_27474/g.66712 Transcript_27474/m.66712 type:complete len:341 (+) Transcript_27474:96-1118(+)|eukprot:CAMPEP_0113630006 /NCGR_PEP_ID=MMETSP0017_2-20120614/15584_1 /TAXON_ID=2856 /ORGANISM="Cylindrotheca closterium" /LENGTH=340 /DNA_ID=CAMNT_0000540441 /DNA_START=72 /DNA_END=1094 /DNA_ORIENTATION=+ /assembly_acc=CAM_ASM_000147